MNLSDEQYEDIKAFASSHGISLYGFQQNHANIILNNSCNNLIYGKNIGELRGKIQLYSQKIN